MRRITNAKLQRTNEVPRMLHLSFVALILSFILCPLSFAGTRTAPSGARISQDVVLDGGGILASPGGAAMTGALGEIAGLRSWGAPNDYLYHGVPGPKFGAPASAPTALFSATPRHGAAPLTVEFMDESLENGSPIVDWDWDFGDHSPHGTDKNPVHEYANPDTYTVALTVTNGKGSTTFTWSDCIAVQAQQMPVDTPMALAALLFGMSLITMVVLHRKTTH